MAVFSNQATLLFGEAESRSNIVTGELLAGLTADKTAIGRTYRPGDRVTYSIRLVNAGGTDFSCLTVTDTLGSYPFEGTVLVPLSYVERSLQFYLDGVPKAPPEVSVGTSLTIRDFSVPAGSTAMLLYETVVNAFAPSGIGGTVTNTATVTGCGLETPLVTEETISAAEDAALVLSKSLCPRTVTENGRLTYTFLIQNTGNREASADVRITDVFDPVLEDITVLYNGTAWTMGENYTYNEQTGIFATGEGEITVPAATYTQNPVTGAFVMTPGVATVEVTGTV